MAQRPFRFVHASDLHLERPLHGLAEVPDHLRKAFLEAPFRAAERVFETALAEQAEFVVLAGDVLHAELAGPHGTLFLVEQFERLRQHGIAVYWAGGEVDPPEAWPSAVPLPANVHVFSSAHPEEHTHHHHGEALAHLIGVSRQRGRKLRAAHLAPAASGLFSIAVVYGSPEREAMSNGPVSYWALGGRHRRDTPFESPRAAHHPGTPQGREPAETGPHGCTVVEVDADGRAHLRFVPTDVMRWRHERVTVDAETTKDDLARVLHERLQSLAASTTGIDLLVSWSITGQGRSLAALRHGALPGELLSSLQAASGHASPAAWSVALEVDPTAPLPEEWYEQNTLLGDYLRTVREIESPADSSDVPPLDVRHYLSERQAAGELAEAVRLDDQHVRRRVLEQAAALGADLLWGEEVRA